MDQDGLLFARDCQDRSLFDTFSFRLKSEPKALAFDLLGIHFLTERAALKRLQPSGCVPRLVKADLAWGATTGARQYLIRILD